MQYNKWKIIPSILAVLLLIFYSSCKNTKTEQEFEVKYKGALKNIMHKGDLSAKASLEEFKSLDNLYALGAFEDLKGEIQIFNSQPTNTFVDANKILFDYSYSKNATLLVYSVVKEWVSQQIPTDISSALDLEKYIEKIASDNNIDTDQPFPFRIEGIIKEVDWHVINWKTGDQEHSHDKHISSGLNGTIENTDAELLGFYSNAHHAIFTHHTTNMHIHVKTRDGKLAGHVDQFVLGINMTLYLPNNHQNVTQ